MEMPEGTTMSRTRDVALRAADLLRQTFPEVESVLSVEGISMTGGRGIYAYEFARYEQAPADIQGKEVAARAAKVAEGYNAE